MLIEKNVSLIFLGELQNCEKRLLVSSCPSDRLSSSNVMAHNDAPQSVGLLWTSDQLVQRPLPLKTQHSQQTNFHAPPPPGGFEPTISAGEWPHTYALDCAATGTGQTLYVAHHI